MISSSGFALISCRFIAWLGVPGVYWQGVPNDHVCCHRMYLQSLPPSPLGPEEPVLDQNYGRTNAAAIGRRADHAGSWLHI